MWCRATVGSNRLLGAAFASPNPNTAGIRSSGCSDSSSSSSLNCPPTAAEQLAARLLLFATSWVLSGGCGEQERQLGPLHSAMLSVLTGAGYAWAVPPGDVGLLGARVCLSSGQWVPWEEDLKAVRYCRGVCSSGVRAVSTMQQGSCTSSAGAGDDGSGRGAASVGSGSGSSSGVDGTQRQLELQPYHVCSAGSVPDEDWDVSPAAAAAALHASYSRGSLSSACTPGGVFLHSQRTCALQCVVYWMLQAGMSPVLYTHPGSGVGTAVRHLMVHTWDTAGAKTGGLMQHGGRSAYPSGCSSCCPIDTAASNLGADTHDGGSVVLQIPAELQASQVAELLRAHGLERQPHSAPLSAAVGQASSVQPLVLLLQTSGSSGDGSCAAEWMRQLLESSKPASPGVAGLLPGTAAAEQAAGAAAGLSGRSNSTWVHAPAVQLLIIVASERCTAAAAAGTCWPHEIGSTARHHLHFSCDCLAAVSSSSSSATHTTHSSTGSTSQGSLRQIPSHPTPLLKRPLVHPRAVVGVMFDRWGHLLPGVPHIPRHLLLPALQEIWCDLSEVLQGLHQQGLLSRVASTSCCFGLPQFQSTLLQLAVLCEQAAEQCSLAGPSNRLFQQQQQQQQGMQFAATVPQTPSTPAAGAMDAVTPGSCVTAARLGGRRLPLKTLCLMVVEALSR
jgi:hypothetical protein